MLSILLQCLEENPASLLIGQYRVLHHRFKDLGTPHRVHTHTLPKNPAFPTVPNKALTQLHVLIITVTVPLYHPYSPPPHLLHQPCVSPYPCYLTATGPETVFHREELKVSNTNAAAS